MELFTETVHLYTPSRYTSHIRRSSLVHASYYTIFCAAATTDPPVPLLCMSTLMKLLQLCPLIDADSLCHSIPAHPRRHHQGQQAQRPLPASWMAIAEGGQEEPASRQMQRQAAPSGQLLPNQGPAQMKIRDKNGGTQVKTAFPMQAHVALGHHVPTQSI